MNSSKDKDPNSINAFDVIAGSPEMTRMFIEGTRNLSAFMEREGLKSIEELLAILKKQSEAMKAAEANTAPTDNQQETSQPTSSPGLGRS